MLIGHCISQYANMKRIKNEKGESYYFGELEFGNGR